MNRDEIRRILAACRPGGQDVSDPLIASALEEVARDPELANWFAQEQNFDRHLTEAFGNMPVPAGLKTRILASVSSRRVVEQPRWRRRVALLAAAVVALFVLFSSWRGPFQPAVSLGDFQSEMVSFIKLAPPLELETSNLDRIQNWLEKAAAPANVQVPPRLAELEPAGCRVLFFRGQKVTLICFRRGEGRLAHLFVVDQAALPSGLRLGKQRSFAQDGRWMTVSWRENGRVYLLAAEGDRDLLEHYLAPPPA